METIDNIIKDIKNKVPILLSGKYKDIFINRYKGNIINIDLEEDFNNIEPSSFYILNINIDITKYKNILKEIIIKNKNIIILCNKPIPRDVLLYIKSFYNTLDDNNSLLLTPNEMNRQLDVVLDEDTDRTLYKLKESPTTVVLDRKLSNYVSKSKLQNLLGDRL